MRKAIAAAIRDMPQRRTAVMSCFGSERECRAYRNGYSDALQDAARLVEQITPNIAATLPQEGKK
jgi:DNA-binding IclR family transcriptional regulator